MPISAIHQEMLVLFTAPNIEDKMVLWHSKFIYHDTVPFDDKTRWSPYSVKGIFLPYYSLRSFEEETQSS